MYRIRFHGRGGQGMKTASRILGRAFFLEGFEVQDAPRYGAERRGAPIFAYVRAARRTVNERGVIQHPDLVVVADETLIPMPAAGILQGCAPETILLIASDIAPQQWQQQLALPAIILTLDFERGAGSAAAPLSGLPGAACIGAAARLLGTIARESLATAIRTELAAMAPEIVAANLASALSAYDHFAPHQGLVREGTSASATDYALPHWVNLALDPPELAAPAIHASASSEQVVTGLWRSSRPVLARERCNRCWWICSTFCPDSAIRVTGERYPAIDYDHCKGCLICVRHCPTHALSSAPEPSVTDNSQGGRP